MRVPNRLATKDAFAPSVSVPGGRFVPPTGGDGSYPTGTDVGGNGGGGVSWGTTVPIIEFYDRSIGASTWSWSFNLNGDVLGTSLVRNPVFTFPGPGVYTATLTTDIGTITKTVTVV